MNESACALHVSAGRKHVFIRCLHGWSGHKINALFCMFHWFLVTFENAVSVEANAKAQIMLAPSVDCPVCFLIPV